MQWQRWIRTRPPWGFSIGLDSCWHVRTRPPWGFSIGLDSCLGVGPKARHRVPGFRRSLSIEELSTTNGFLGLACIEGSLLPWLSGQHCRTIIESRYCPSPSTYAETSDDNYWDSPSISQRAKDRQYLPCFGFDRVSHSSDCNLGEQALKYHDRRPAILTV